MTPKIINFGLGVLILGFVLRGNVVLKICYISTRSITKLSQTAFHRIGWLYWHTMTDSEWNGAFTSLRNIVIVNTADSMECCLTEISRCLKYCFGCLLANFKNHIALHKNSPRIKMSYPKLMILVSFYLKKNFLPHEIMSNIWHFVNDILKITDHSCCILSGLLCIFSGG